MAADEAQPSAVQKQVTVRLTTQLSEAYKIPGQPLSVPSDITRLGFSKILHQLLQLEPARVFDVLLDGELLRGTLEDTLVEHSKSTEGTVELEYTFLTLPPQLDETIPQQDWIRTVAGLAADRICSGSCSGRLQIVAGTGKAVASAAAAHDGAVTAVARLDSVDERELLLSAGQDCVARLWRMEGASVAPVLRLDGHTDAIDCAAARGDTCATGGWDAAVRVWRWRRLLEDAEAEPSGEPGKRPRGAAAGAAACPVATEAAVVLQGHTAAVSGVAWAEAERLVSSSWDHGLRRWDVARGQHTDAMATGKALLCVAALGQGGGVVAAGGADGVLRIWDSRAHTTETLALKAFRTSSVGMTCVAARPGSDTAVATGSHDGAVRLWDLRSSLPLAVLEAHGDRCLAVAWRDSERLVSGGCDAKLHLFSTPPAGAAAGLAQAEA